MSPLPTIKEVTYPPHAKTSFAQQKKNAPSVLESLGTQYRRPKYVCLDVANNLANNLAFLGRPAIIAQDGPRRQCGIQSDHRQF